MNKSVLLLGSTSVSRQQLLQESKIPYQLIGQQADETLCDWGLPLEQLVTAIALYKMDHVEMPKGVEGQTHVVLTADTLSQDSQGAIHGKPIDKADAITKLKQLRTTSIRTGTAFCLDRKQFYNGSWIVQQRIVRFVDAYSVVNVPDAWIERYLENTIGIKAAGAIAIEGYGNLFLESVHGSYSTIVGLPLVELRQALEEIGFF